MNIEIYTDGSSYHNGRPDCVAGWASVFYLGKKKYVRYGHLPIPSSSNRGEIYGVLYTIMTLKSKKDWRLNIHSDSQYVVKSINEWRFGWARKGFRDVKNLDLFLPLFDAWEEHGNARIQWVKAHVGTEGNEEADHYAGLGTQNIIINEDTPEHNIQFVQQKTYR